LLPVEKSVLRSYAKLMHGMDKHYDGYAWTKTIMSHIMNLTIRTLTCTSHLHCENLDNKYISHIHCTSLINEMEDGSTPTPFVVVQPAFDRSSFLCRICKVSPKCIATYGARISYVFGTASMTCACMHLGLHKHLVKAGENQKFKEWIRTLIGKQLKRTPKATNSEIVMEATKELVGELMLHPEVALARKFDLKELVNVLDKFKYMSLPSMQNNGTTFRYLRRFGVVNGITMHRGYSH
jgi:hypothetical protein